jgi:CDP-diglyceride synthetase
MSRDRDDPPDFKAAESAARWSLADKVYWSLLVLLQMVMAVELVFLLIEAQWLNALLVGGIMAVVMAPAILAPRLHVRIPAEFQLMAVVFVFASLFLGEILRYYDRYSWWDTMLHAWSGLLMGIFGFLLVHLLNENRSIDGQLRPGFVAFFAFLFALSVGTLWEIFEFAVDEMFGQMMQTGGLGDTMWDLIFDALGAAAISTFGWWYLRRPEHSFIERWVQKFIERNPRLFRN